MAIDLYEKNVVLALNFDGAITDGALLNKKTVTANGNAAISTVQKKYGSHACYFDGSGDTLTIPASSDFDFGTGPFTIEGWVYSDLTQQGTLFDLYQTAVNTQDILVYLRPYGCIGFFYGNGVLSYIDATDLPLIQANTWSHFACVRQVDGTINVFQNGVKSSFSAINTNAMGWSATYGPFIGGRRGGTNYLKGYIDDLRVTKGVARYQKNFIPPLETFGMGFQGTISGTVKDANGDFAQRLVRAYRRLDGAMVSEGFSDPVSGAFSLGCADTSKHCAIVYDSDALITYLPFNGPNNSTVFDEWSGKVVTPFGNVKISTTQSKFGGASALFDGSGDYLTLPASSDLDFGASDFTIELWVRFNSIATTQGVFATHALSSGHTPVLIYLTGGNMLFFSSSTLGVWDVANAATIKSGVAAGVWYHVAVCRAGGNIRLFCDGVLVNTVTVNGALLPLSGNTPSIGQWAGGSWLNGHLDDLRISKGVARYTANFTPPAAPQEPGVNTKNALIYDLLTPV